MWLIIKLLLTINKRTNKKIQNNYKINNQDGKLEIVPFK